ncbi:hypothetical protein So717_10260 [Roseobacter cerasinus]|uniref:Uncharacterized protein n=1 Tax=Roseobacter cerasinus TaxID=2602289 RepID=A0A640VLV3_9RHOB|nr:hypothetical protein So717_10260 [Roseobacter cerasinus]
MRKGIGVGIRSRFRHQSPIINGDAYPDDLTGACGEHPQSSPLGVRPDRSRHQGSQALPLALLAARDDTCEVSYPARRDRRNCAIETGTA